MLVSVWTYVGTERKASKSEVLFVAAPSHTYIETETYDGQDLSTIELGGGTLRWINDRFCDDMNNNEACNYDEGDCCGTLINKRYCVSCKCKSKNLFSKINYKFHEF